MKTTDDHSIFSPEFQAILTPLQKDFKGYLQTDGTGWMTIRILFIWGVLLTPEDLLQSLSNWLKPQESPTRLSLTLKALPD